MSSLPSQQEVKEATRKAQSTLSLQPVPINAYEATNALVVVAPFPAVQPDDVTVEVHRNKLRMFAEIRSAGPRDYLVEEWGYGGFEREFELPEGFGVGVEASLANGQLAVRVLRGVPSETPIRIKPTATAVANRPQA